MEFWVDLVDNPGEEPSIESLGYGVPRVHSLNDGVQTLNGLPMSDNRSDRQNLQQLTAINLKKLGHYRTGGRRSKSIIHTIMC